MIPYDKREGHKFCIRCGEELIQEMAFVYMYDRETGKEVMHYWVRCPNYRWYSQLHFREEFDEEGTMIANYP